MEKSGQLHAPTALHPGKQPGTHWVGGWASPRAGLDDVEKREILPHREWNSDPLGSRYTDYLI
jgi:hypothetical protein